MQLTRVSGASAHPASQAIATGGDADLLALLLGAGDASPGFPLTLEAALGAGSVEGPLGEAGEAETAPDGEPSVDAALAAALTLGAILPPAVAVDATPVEDGTPAIDAASPTATIVASAGAGPSLEIPAGAAAAAGPAPTGAPADADADAAAIDATPTPAPPDDAAVAPKTEARGTGRTVPTPASGPTPASAPSAAAPAGDDRVRATSAQRGSSDVTTVRALAAGATHHGHDADDTDAPPSFEHRGEGDAGRGAFAGAAENVTAEPPAKLALTVTLPGLAGDVTHATRAGADDSGATAAVQASTSSGSTSTPSPASPAVAGERAGLGQSPIEARWSERVGDAVRLSALRGGGEIRLQLEPEGLGHIDVRLDLHADGVRAVIVAEHESTRALLQSQQQVLQDALGKSDLRLSGFSVDVGSDGAASFQAGTEGGERGDAPAPASREPASLPTTTDAADGGSVPLGSGRVNVRV